MSRTTGYSEIMSSVLVKTQIFIGHDKQANWFSIFNTPVTTKQEEEKNYTAHRVINK
jgi:hypothetical protein